MSQNLDPDTFIETNIPVINIDHPAAEKHDVALYIKREDQVHPRISGNKWRKLKYNLLEARKAQRTTLLTFGGAFSNHIAAVAEAGFLFGFKTIGIIRGEAPQGFNPTLERARENGMRLEFISRSLYRNKDIALKQIRFDQSDTYLIPEGGTNHLALKGCAEIIRDCEITEPIDYWCTACGTGGTAAGMITALNAGQQVLGFPVLKGNFMANSIRDLLKLVNSSSKQWELFEDYHFGGYARFTPELIHFINEFKKTYAIALDPVYTGKMVYGVVDLVKKGYFQPGSRVMMIHTGGLQGIAGFNQRFGNIIQ